MTTSNTGERLYRGNAPARAVRGRTSRLGNRARWRDDAGAAAARWLGGDGGWPRFEPAEPRPRSRRAPAGGADLGIDLERWRGRVSRRRALVIARRHVLVAAVLTLAAVAVIALAGGDRRSPWLLAPVVVAALAIGAALRARPVTTDRTARMLDRELGLRDRVGTALELSRGRPARLRAGGSPAGLDGLVIDEARAAVAASLGEARLRLPPAGAEWAALVALATVLGVLLALAPARHAGGPPSRAAASAGKAHGAARIRSGSQARRSSHRAGAATRGRAPLRSGAAAGQRGAAGPRLNAQQIERDAAAAERNPPATHVSGGQPPRPQTTVFRSAARGSNVALPGQFEAVPTRGGSSGGGLAAPKEVAGGAVGFSGSSAPVSAAARTRSRTGPSRGTAHSVTGSRGGAAGGSRAGDQPGGTGLGPGEVPNVPHSSIGLPLQAGYAPSAARRPRSGEGSSQIPDGGDGAARTVQVDGGTGSADSAFAVIPPFSDAVPAGEAPQLDDYFGVANQQDPGRW